MTATFRDRIPPLEGGLNFRDLGGYRTADGLTVRWNLVYRSGTTHAMTAADVARLSNQGIRFAYDLRSNDERRDQPNRLRDIANLDYRYRDHDHLPGDIRRLIKSQDARAEHSHRMMIEVYQKLPYDFAASFSALFQHLADGDMPLVFNCTAGKDRTGVAAALLLTALGISRDAVLEDYLLSNRFFDRSCELVLTQGGEPLFGAIDRAVWEPLMKVHPDYLQAMFDQVEASYGSVDRYLHDRLGLDTGRIDKMRSRLLE